MTFTYAGTLATDLDRIRFHIGDRVSGSGCRPDGLNFTDEELNGLLSIEGSYQRAVAAAFETLAGEWARYVNITLGPRSEQLGMVAEGYRKQGEMWRKKYGSGGTVSRARVTHATRVDGYSTDIPGDAA